MSMAGAMEKFDLVTRGQSLVQDHDKESLRDLLAKKGNVKIAWETTPTGKPHVGYFVPLAKLADFIKAGLEVTIFYLDVYAFVINFVHPMDLIEHRRKYYHFLVSAILQSLGVDLSKVRFVSESSFAYTKPFFTDVLRTTALMTQQDAKDADQEIEDATMLSPLLSCIYQTLSEQYLDIDIQFGGEDQFRLFSHSTKFLPLLGYRKREHLMNVMVTGLHGEKMSSSDPADTKIEFLDSAETVARKIGQITCKEGDTNNPVLLLLKDVIFPISLQRAESLASTEVSWEADPDNRPRPFTADDAPTWAVFSIPGEAGGSARHYKHFDDIQGDFLRSLISIEALKVAVTAAFQSLLEPIRAMYRGNHEWQAVEKLAYPD